MLPFNLLVQNSELEITTSFIRILLTVSNGKHLFIESQRTSKVPANTGKYQVKITIHEIARGKATELPINRKRKRVETQFAHLIPMLLAIFLALFGFISAKESVE